MLTAINKQAKRRPEAVKPQITQCTPKTLVGCNLRLLENQELCDVYFVIGNTKIGCHKLFLMSRSTVFQAMFAERWDRHEKSEIPLVDCDPRYFRLFLEFIYADRFVTSVGDAIHLLALADKYDVPLLKQKCQELIETAISLEDSVAVYQAARLYNLPDLQKSACEIMCEDFDQLMKHPTFYQADEETLAALLKDDDLSSTELDIFHGLLRWNTNGKSTTALKKLISLVRFPVMSADEFSRHVVPTKVLSNEEIIELFTFFHAEPTARNKLLTSNFSTVPRKLSRVEVTKVLELYPSPRIHGSLNLQIRRFHEFEDTLRFYYSQQHHYFGGDQQNYSIRTVKLRGPGANPNGYGYLSQPYTPTTEETWKVTLIIREGQECDPVVFQKSDITISNMKDTCIVIQPPVPLTHATWYLISVKFHSAVTVFYNAMEGFNPNNFCKLARAISINDGSVSQLTNFGNISQYIACSTAELGLSTNSPHRKITPKNPPYPMPGDW